MEALIFIHRDCLSYPCFQEVQHGCLENIKTDEKKAGGRRDGGSDEGMKVGGALFLF